MSFKLPFYMRVQHRLWGIAFRGVPLSPAQLRLLQVADAEQLCHSRRLGRGLT